LTATYVAGNSKETSMLKLGGEAFDILYCLKGNMLVPVAAPSKT